MKLPSWGGNTCFSNMYKAYENIPRPLRDKLEGKKVLQVHDYKRRERLDIDKIDLNSVRHHEQPIFITHPATGRKALYISRLMSARIDGLSTRRERDGARAAVRDLRRPGDRLRARMEARRPRDLGQLVLDPRPQGFPARRAAADAPADHRRAGDAVLTSPAIASCPACGHHVCPTIDHGLRLSLQRSLTARACPQLRQDGSGAA